MLNKDNLDNALFQMIDTDMKSGTYNRPVCTRFPPEPNGYLHIGNAYAIHTSYTVAEAFNGNFHLRFDDTNPLKEDMEYVNAILEDMKWLGYDPGAHIYYGSDYSEEIFQAAVTLIKQGKAYVCDLTPEELTRYRGTLTEGGTNSPYRERSIEENLDLFNRMRGGEYPTSSKVLRAKIDMGSPNINLRDPVIYRIIHAPHYRSGSKWCVYPMYDFAHPIQDAIEGITHSLCSIEFKDHRPLYEWVLNELKVVDAPRQYEFGRLNVTGVVTSKRYLRQLVEGEYVDGWDDPRLSTIRGLRRRGFTPESIRTFIDELGLIRHQSTVDIAMLEQALRQDLKTKVNSVMVVLNPLKVVITNYPEDHVELLSVENNSENEALGTREVPFASMLYIERDDFMEEPTRGFRRLVLHGEVRLKGAYFIRCNEVVRDDTTGEITELRCTYDVETKSGSGFTGRKVKGTIHWVSVEHGLKVDVNMYEKLLLSNDAVQDDSKTWADLLNPNSLTILSDCIAEPFLKSANPHDKFQFMRHGYFNVDPKHSTSSRLVLNRIVALKDGWK